MKKTKFKMADKLQREMINMNVDEFLPVLRGFCTANILQLMLNKQDDSNEKYLKANILLELFCLSLDLDKSEELAKQMHEEDKLKCKEEVEAFLSSLSEQVRNSFTIEKIFKEKMREYYEDNEDSK